MYNAQQEGAAQPGAENAGGGNNNPTDDVQDVDYEEVK
jgi:hypothetical protein